MDPDEIKEEIEESEEGDSVPKILLKKYIPTTSLIRQTTHSIDPSNVVQISQFPIH